MAVWRILLLWMLAPALASVGCARNVSLRYVSPEPVAVSDGPALVSVVPFRDARRNEPHDLGRVRGIFGNALKIVRTERPVADEVTQVFREALEVHGLLSADSSGPLLLGGEIRKLDCNQYREHEAHAELSLRLVDARGRLLLERVYASEHEGGGMFTSSVFASRRRLGALAERMLTEAIDAALADPAFRVAATGKASPRSTGLALPSGGRSDPGAAPQGPAAAPPDSEEPESELEALDRLYEQGLLSDEEYARRRANLLGAL